jgi:precorrin-2 dehydrogenase/sirohydrochlorin ferrochelatase
MIYQAMKKSRANSTVRRLVCRLVEMESRSEYAFTVGSKPKETDVPHLPLSIDMHGMIVLVVGGGPVAERKITSLLDAGADVRIVAPVVTPEIARLVASGAIKVKIGCYQTSDLTDVFLAVAATNDQHINRKVADEAHQRGMLVIVTDNPKSGNVTFPAVLRRGDLEVSVSTNGTCPGFSAEVRDMLSTVIGEEYGRILATLALEREKLLTEGAHSTYNNKILRSRARELIHELTKHKERVP